MGFLNHQEYGSNDQGPFFFTPGLLGRRIDQGIEGHHIRRDARGQGPSEPRFGVALLNAGGLVDVVSLDSDKGGPQFPVVN